MSYLHCLCCCCTEYERRSHPWRASTTDEENTEHQDAGGPDWTDKSTEGNAAAAGDREWEQRQRHWYSLTCSKDLTIIPYRLFVIYPWCHLDIDLLLSTVTNVTLVTVLSNKSGYNNNYLPCTSTLCCCLHKSGFLKWGTKWLYWLFNLNVNMNIQHSSWWLVTESYSAMRYLCAVTNHLTLS